MKSKIDLVIFLIIFHYAFAQVLSEEVNSIDEEAWKTFKERFSKNYTQEEEESRKKVFIDNLHFIQSHNTKSNLKFKQDVHGLSDLTSEEIVKTRCGFRVNPDFNRRMFHTESLTSESDLLERSNKGLFERVFPSNLDWRNQGRVSKVKDQGKCASCWAFATTGALEGILAARRRGILLSEQNLIDCSADYETVGCSSGTVEAAFRYIKNNGIMSSLDYPYAGSQRSSCNFTKEKSKLALASFALLPSGNEHLLLLALALMGPIPVSIDASSRAFHNYKSGIFDEDHCKSGLGDINHAVLLVGYGTDQDIGDYWLIKNSWGSNWGDGGYVKIARNRGNLCGVASYAVLPIPERE